MLKQFFPFRIDPVNHRLWHGETAVSLRPKAFAILSYLVQRAGRLVSHDELLDALWRDTFVQPDVLKSHILEVRAALGDDPKNPTFIETVPRRGYRFIKEVIAIPNTASVSQIIGRERELEELHGRLRRAHAGERQVVFVTGEAGIGKTTLADVFVKDAKQRVSSIRISRSQSVEGYGLQEPYYPILMALAQVLQEKEELVSLMESHAPTWLVQFPGLLKPEHRQLLQREILGATRQRMVREFCDVLPVISAEETLLFVLEDIHWADAATVELIAAISHSRSPARLMLVATYRPVEVVLSQHPLKMVKQDLLLRRLCHELPVESLSEAEVARYLSARLPGHNLPQGLAGMMHRLSEGNPLFLRAVLDHLGSRGDLTFGEGGWKINVSLTGIEMEVPESLRQLLELQFARLSDNERRVLEAASVCGVSFLANIAAAAGNIDLETYEDICQKLAQESHMVRVAGLETLPSGAVTLRCKFIHAVYRQAIYDRLPPQRRSRLHLQMGESLEDAASYSKTPANNPMELALHFEAGCDWKRAAKYLVLATARKGERFAYREVAADLERALKLLAKLPATEGAAIHIEVMQKLGAIYFALEDFAAAVATLQTVVRRASIARDSGTEIDTLIQLGIIVGRIDMMRCLSLANQLVALSEREQDSVLRARARMGALILKLAAGDSQKQDIEQFRVELAEVRSHGDRCVLAAHTTEYAVFQLFSSEYSDSIRSIEESVPVLVESGDIRHRAAVIIQLMALIFSGNWGRALRVAQDAVATAQRNGNHSREHALLIYQAWPHVLAHDWNTALELCEAALPTLKDPDQTVFRRQGLILAGTALVGLARYELASKYLAEARQQMDTRPVELDWYWKMPLQSALTELLLQRGDVDQARVEVQLFVKTSLITQERTWQALAWQANARVAIAGSDLQKGQEYIRQAMGVMQGFDVPLACWRVHATAMQLFTEGAEEHQRQAAAVIQRLAESLDEFPSLQNTFISSKSVRSVTVNKAAVSKIGAV